MNRHALLLPLLVSCSLARAQTPPPDPAPATAAPPPAPAKQSADQPPPAQAATKTPPPAPTKTVAASGILGRKVLGPDGKEIGRVVDVLVDAGSNPRAAVIDVGGFLGVGMRRIAVNWSDLTFPPTGSDTDIKLDLTSEEISSAPAYTDQTQPAKVVQPPPLKPAAQPEPPGR
jgi:sporulation protein YlmC with PRC-barrel domain